MPQAPVPFYTPDPGCDARFLLQRLCQIDVNGKKSRTSIDCKLLRRNDFFGLFHKRNTGRDRAAPGMAYRGAAGRSRPRHGASSKRSRAWAEESEIGGVGTAHRDRSKCADDQGPVSIHAATARIASSSSVAATGVMMRPVLDERCLPSRKSRSR